MYAQLIGLLGTDPAAARTDELSRGLSLRQRIGPVIEKIATAATVTKTSIMRQVRVADWPDGDRCYSRCDGHNETWFVPAVVIRSGCGVCSPRCDSDKHTESSAS